MRRKIVTVLICAAMLLTILPLQVLAAAGVSTPAELASAFAAGGEIKLGADITMVDQTLIVAAGSVVTLDLNGHVLSGYFTSDSTSAIITNNGTFTLNDSVGSGKITMDATDPSVERIPGYASNAVSNCGIMIMNSGTIENATVKGYATYCIDNQSNARDAILTINGGTLFNKYTDCIRQACMSNKANRVTINGGYILQDDPYDRAIWIQIFGNNVPSAISLTINDGEFVGGITTYSFATGAGGYFTAAQSEATSICINGGTGSYLEMYALGNAKVHITDGEMLYCDLAFSGSVDPDLSVTGGEFLDECYAWSVDDPFISGGIFHTNPGSKGETYLPYLQLMDGYTLCEIKDNVYEVHGKWNEMNKKNTCTKEGSVYYFECSTCHNKYEEDFELVYDWDPSTGELIKTILDIEPLTNVSVNALGHDLTGDAAKWVHDDATQKQNSQHMRFCKRNCGYSEHEACSFVMTERVEPTPEKDGKIVYACSVCGYSYEVPLHADIPLTDDNSHVFLLIAMLLLSGGALAGGAVFGKKQKIG